MLSCEGYKMFRGVMAITYKCVPPKHIRGVWLYKPEYDCWYCNGQSYVASACTVVEDATK